MIGKLAPPPVSPRKKKLALAIAAVADAIQIFAAPVFFQGVLSPLDDALDFIISAILIMVLGFRWQLALAFAAELIPGLDIFPTWTLFVATIPTQVLPAGGFTVETLPRDESKPMLEPTRQANNGA